MRKFLRRLFRAVLLAVVLAAGFALFFVLHCRPMPLQFAATSEAARHPLQAQGIANYARDEVDAFYTYPEWYIVWSYQSKADYQRTGLLSHYSWLGDIQQFWQGYCAAYGYTRKVYPFATGEHIMLAVIGSSFTAEYLIKGTYEGTIGRLSEWTAHHQPVAEDAFAADVAEQYAQFVHIRPFYEFHFAHALNGLWHVPFQSTHLLRTFERRVWYTFDYGAEALYCELIELGTHATYGFEDVDTSAWIDYPESNRAAILAADPHLKIVRDLPEQNGSASAIFEIPRYQEFTPAAVALIAAGAHFHQIAGNELISVSVISQGPLEALPGDPQILLAQQIPSDRSRTRTLLLCPVASLDQLLPSVVAQRAIVEHIYDF